MKKISIVCAFLIMSFASFSQNNYTTYVNPFIGTGGHGHTYPGATMPFGFVQLSPDTRTDGYNDWDGCSGYHYSDSVIYAFSHTHLSGTGIADYCDIALMPSVGASDLQNLHYTNSPLGQSFSHANEKASPGYYAVLLNTNIQVELTATKRVGFHKYKFPQTNKANIILDLTHRDKLLEGSYIEIISPTKIQGLRRSSSWAKDQWIYFAIEFSQPFIQSDIIDSALQITNTIPSIASGTHLKANFQFNCSTTNTIYVKCALSPISCVGAWKNMQAETPDWNFDKIKNDANEAWNNALSKIEVTSNEDATKTLTDSTNKLVIFYTALYHCMLAPNIYEDVDGKYRGRDNKIHDAVGFDYYTVFSLWDTYRALHPLMTIIDQKRTSDFINTFLKQYEQAGRLPVWELSSNETDCMIGYHAVSVIADAAVKKINGFDLNEAYTAMTHSANLDINGLNYYNKKGYIESNEEPESVSKTLEYSYDDWCIAQMAHVLTKKNDERLYAQKSANYKNVMDGYFARPRFNGGWYSPFNPYEVNFNYTEANAWQYSFSYAYNFNEFINVMDTAIVKKCQLHLDSLFTTTENTAGRVQSDITGLIGQYAQGNEPSHHIAYLYNYVFQSWKTQYYIHKIRTDFYKNTPTGLIGNEDCGQMSAWYVLSALGFYPVAPGEPVYSIGTPAFTTAAIHLENGKTFTLSANTVSINKPYIQSMKINNGSANWSILNHADIMNGSTISFTMGDKPNYNWGRAIAPFTKNTTPSAPLILAGENAFSDSLNILITARNKNDVLQYAFDSTHYIQTNGDTIHLTLFDKTHIYAIACNGNTNCSGISTAYFTKLNAHTALYYKTHYDNQYTASGDKALIDGLRGGNDFRTGMWQGWQGYDMEVVMDMGSEKKITQAGAGFLQDIRSWIWMPTTLEIYTSTDNINFKFLTTIYNKVADTLYESKEIQNMSAIFSPVQTRYVKFVAHNFGSIPSWHPGAGSPAWIFCDEVFVQ